MLRSILYPIIICACGSGCACNYLACLCGKIGEAFIKLAQWVSVYKEGCRGREVGYTAEVGKLSQHSSWTSKETLLEWINSLCYLRLHVAKTSINTSELSRKHGRNSKVFGPLSEVPMLWMKGKHQVNLGNSPFPFPFPSHGAINVSSAIPFLVNCR